jgi:hypothetical protein
MSCVLSLPTAGAYVYLQTLRPLPAVSDPAFKGVVDKLGERGAMGLIGLTGYWIFLHAK